MRPPSHKELSQLLDAIKHADVLRKKEQLLAANREAARALLASIPTVSYTTTKKKESNESSE